MAIRYYDDLVTTKIQRWLPEQSILRVLHPDETKRLFELTADDNKDKGISLPLVALSRRDEVELLSTVKSPKSYDGLHLKQSNSVKDLSNLRGEALRQALQNLPEKTYQFNVLPIKPEYQLDIYAKTAEECEEYLRNFLFKLINNPLMIIKIPYQSLEIEHTVNIRVLSNIANTSAVTECIFSGQFTRWTIQFELQDAFLFSIPYRKNWTLAIDQGGTLELMSPAKELESVEILDPVLGTSD